MIPASRAHRRPAQAARHTRQELFFLLHRSSSRGLLASFPLPPSSFSLGPLGAPHLLIPDVAALSHLLPHTNHQTHLPTSHTYPHYRGSVIIAPEGHPVHYVGGPRDDPTLRERKDGSIFFSPTNGARYYQRHPELLFARTSPLLLHAATCRMRRGGKYPRQGGEGGSPLAID